MKNISFVFVEKFTNIKNELNYIVSEYSVTDKTELDPTKKYTNCIKKYANCN